MAAFIFFGVVILACQVLPQCIPRPPLPCIQQPQPVVAPPVVAATIIDNSVSNALANALQLLIVSNLIENTLNCPKVAQVCDPNPTYSCIDVTPEIISPIVSYDPIYTRPMCDVSYIAPCDTINVRTCFPDVAPVVTNFGYVGCDYPNIMPSISCNCPSFAPSYDCDCGNFIPNVGCGCNGLIPNIGCDYPTIVPSFDCDYTIGCDYSTYMPSVGCDCGNFLSNMGCGCNNLSPVCNNVMPSCNNLISNLGCDFDYIPNTCRNVMPSFGYNSISPTFACPYQCNSVGPIATEFMIPSAIPAQLSCNLGCMPNSPCMCDPWASLMDSCGCGNPYSNGFYY